MPPRRRIASAPGRAAVELWQQEPAAVSPQTLALAVRFTLEEVAACDPGHSVEVRVPPLGVIQCVAGPRHTRGTPANVVETDPQTWLALATGVLDWPQALASGAVIASGERADLAHVLPCT